VRDAADLVAADTGTPRREVYQRALFLAKGGQTESE
jgi:16S rRNA (cytidine1402-2'-O)-methyltransferase